MRLRKVFRSLGNGDVCGLLDVTRQVLLVVNAPLFAVYTGLLEDANGVLARVEHLTVAYHVFVRVFPVARAATPVCLDGAQGRSRVDDLKTLCHDGLRPSYFYLGLGVHDLESAFEVGRALRAELRLIMHLIKKS